MKKCPCCNRTKEEHNRPKFVLECRDKDGKLLFQDVNGKAVAWPPSGRGPNGDWTENELTDYFFAHVAKDSPLLSESEHGHGSTASMENIAAWFAERNWYWRRKTW